MLSNWKFPECVKPETERKSVDIRPSVVMVFCSLVLVFCSLVLSRY